MKIRQSAAVLRGHRFGPGHPALAVLRDMHFRAVVTFGCGIAHLHFRSPTLRRSVNLSQSLQNVVSPVFSGVFCNIKILKVWGTNDALHPLL